MGSARGVILLLALVALAPPVKAEPAAGSLEIDGTMTLPGGATSEGRLVAAIATGALAGLEIAAPRLRVTVYEAEYLVVGATEVSAGPRPRSFALTDGEVAQAAPAGPSAYAGVHPGADATLAVRADDLARVRPRVATVLGSGGEGTPDVPSDHWYRAETRSPHVEIEATGSMTACGAARFKLFGVDVSVRGRENETAQTIRTGRFQEDPARARYVWLDVAAEDGCLSTGPGATIHAAVRGEAALAWSGRAILTPRSGEVRTPGASYAATGASAFLEGDMAGALAPRADGRAATLRLDGDLRATSLPATRVAPPGFAPAPSTVGFAVLGLVLGAAGVGAAAWGLRRRHVALPRDEYVDYLVSLADQAIALRRFEVALKHLQAATRLAPARTDVRFDLAWTLRQLGRAEEAALVYEALHHATENGDAALERALLAEKLDRPRAETLHWATLALGRSPYLLYELEAGDLASLRGGADWDAVLDVAEARLAREDAERRARGE